MTKQDLIDLTREAIENVHDMDVTLEDYAKAAVEALGPELMGEAINIIESYEWPIRQHYLRNDILTDLRSLTKELSP